MSIENSIKSGWDGPLEKFGVSIEVVRHAVKAVCRRYRCSRDHIDEALGAVFVQILEVHHKNEQYFKNTEHIIGYSRIHAKFYHLNVFDSAEARRLEYRDSIALDTVAAGSKNDERQQLLNLLRDCERVTGLLNDRTPEIAEVFRMHHCKQMDGDAIAKQVGRGKVTVWRRLRIAYAILKRRLQTDDQG